METRHNQVNSRIIPSSDSTNNDSTSSKFPLRKFTLVRETILKSLKTIIPFSVLSSSFLFTNINKVKAEVANNWIFESEGIFYKIAKHKSISEGGDGGFFETWKIIGDFILNMIKWFINLPENVTQMSINLLTKLYEILMLILQTPLFIFNNSYIKDTSLVFSLLSIFIVSVLTVIELIKRMLKKKHTDSKEIVKRWTLAVVGSGFSPFLFEQSFNLLNIASKAITKIGASEMRAESVVSYMKMSGFNTVLLLGFDLILISIMIPVLLQNGRRFFNLLCLSCLTPLALTSWVFDDYKHYFNKWWTSVKSLASVQLIYSTFICIFGVFIFGTRNIVDGGGFFIKLLISIGMLQSFANPPNFIKQRLDNGDDIFDMGKSIWKSAKGVWNTVSFRPTRLFIQKQQASKLSKTQALRKKHGQRYVKGLS